MKIREIMTKDLVTMAEDRPLSEAAHAMRDRGIGDVIVTAGGQVRGLVTDRDIVVRALAEDKDPRSTRLGDIASRDLVTLSPDDDADRAVEIMKQRAVRRLPVVEGGRPVGIVSLGDLAQRRDRASALGEISAAPPNA